MEIEMGGTPSSLKGCGGRRLVAVCYQKLGASLYGFEHTGQKTEEGEKALDYRRSENENYGREPIWLNTGPLTEKTANSRVQCRGWGSPTIHVGGKNRGLRRNRLSGEGGEEAAMAGLLLTGRTSTLSRHSIWETGVGELKL